MTAPIVVLTDRNREPEAWLQARRRGLGGSEVAAACGLSRWRSPLEVWLAKLDLEQPPRQESESMSWGHALEEPIRAEVAKRLSTTVMPERKLYRAADLPFALGSPDALVMDRENWLGVGEWKLIGPRLIGAWEEGPAIDAELQLRWYLMILGCERGWIGALLGGVELQVFELERDPEIEGLMVERARAFWRLVEDRTPPVIVGTQEERDALRAAFPALAGEAPVELDWEAQMQVRRRAMAILEEKEAEQRRLQAENELRLLLQGSRAGQVGGKVVLRLTEYERRTIDADALRAAEPEIAERFTKTSKADRWWTPKEKE